MILTGRAGWKIALQTAVLALVTAAGTAAMGQADRAQSNSANAHVILVMTDGLRWQEVFRGADESLLVPSRYYNGRSVTELKKKYLAATPEARREKLMPFLWSTLIPQGQIYGDRDAGSDASVTNGFNFSYPGYSETLTGHGDPRINSNDNKPNPNLTVLAWLNHQPGFEGKVAAFGAWNVISAVVNPERCDCVTNSAYEPLKMTPSTPRLDLLNAIKAETPRMWEDEAFDTRYLPYDDGISPGETASCAVSVAWRYGRVGPRRKLWGVSGVGPSVGRISETDMGRSAEHA